MRLRSISLAVLAVALASAQTETPSLAHNEVVEIQGVIERIHLTPGEGTPYLEVRTDNETARVHLGPMRYLIEEDFAPKTGQDIVVEGYRVDDYVVAIEVRLPSEKKTLRLRDEDGLPLWRGAQRRMRRQQPTQ